MYFKPTEYRRVKVSGEKWVFFRNPRISFWAASSICSKATIWTLDMLCVFRNLWRGYSLRACFRGCFSSCCLVQQLDRIRHVLQFRLSETKVLIARQCTITHTHSHTNKLNTAKFAWNPSASLSIQAWPGTIVFLSLYITAHFLRGRLQESWGYLSLL